MLETEVKYEENYVCFIDILGFKQAILDPDSHRNLVLSPSFFWHLLGEMQRLKNWESSGLKVTQFSDCLVLSGPATHLTLYVLLSSMVWLQGRLLEVDFLIRGAIMKGDVFHSNTHIFGPALVNAVECEKLVQMPLVALSHEIVNDNQIYSEQGVGYTPAYIASTPIEHLGKITDVPYLDFFSTYFHRYNINTQPSSEDNVIKSFIVHNMMNLKYGVKYQWFAGEWNKVVERKGLNQKLIISPTEGLFTQL